MGMDVAFAVCTGGALGGGTSGFWVKVPMGDLSVKAGGGGAGVSTAVGEAFGMVEAPTGLTVAAVGGGCGLGMVVVHDDDVWTDLVAGEGNWTLTLALSPAEWPSVWFAASRDGSPSESLLRLWWVALSLEMVFCRFSSAS